jgi:hypothetical protein
LAIAHDGGSRFQARFPIRRRDENYGVADRRGFWRTRRRRIARRRSSRRRPDRSGNRQIWNGAKRSGAGFQRGLTAHDLFELLVELFLIEQLAAGRAIDPGAEFGDAVFVGVLHLGLARDQPRENVVTKGEVGCGRGRPQAEQDHRADHDPERHRTKPDLFAGMHNGVALLRVRRGHRGTVHRRAASRGPALIMRVVVGVL